MTKRRIVIIGLGLMGGSLGLAFRKKLPQCEIVGLTRSVKKIRAARQRKIIHWGSRDASRVLRRADFVFVATPISKIPYWLKKTDTLAPKGTIVTDVGSVKGLLVRWADRFPFRRIHYVGSHPMAGSHESGLDSARPGLFERASVLVTRGRKTHVGALREVKNLWKKIARRVMEISPETHDTICARVSHIPHLLAALLVHDLSPSHFRFVGPGFLDATRISQGDPRLWLEIVETNRRALARELRAFEKKLHRLSHQLANSRKASLLALLKKAARKRKGLERSSPPLMPCLPAGRGGDRGGSQNQKVLIRT